MVRDGVLMSDSNMGRKIKIPIGDVFNWNVFMEWFGGLHHDGCQKIIDYFFSFPVKNNTSNSNSHNEEFLKMDEN